jgi:hypothetical protein
MAREMAELQKDASEMANLLEEKEKQISDHTASIESFSRNLE